MTRIPLQRSQDTLSTRIAWLARIRKHMKTRPASFSTGRFANERGTIDYFAQCPLPSLFDQAELSCPRENRGFALVVPGTHAGDRGRSRRTSAHLTDTGGACKRR